MDQDTFFVSVERRKNSALEGMPVIIGGTGDRGVVASCSYEARKFGVHAAMPARTARLLCPDAVFVRGNMEDYSKASFEITDILKERVPILEKASIDEHYIDMTGMDRYIGTMKFAHELRELVMKETALPISLGLSVNKTVSKIATGTAKPNGEKHVEKGSVRDFLNPLPIAHIPGVGNVTYLKLAEMGVKRIATLAEIPRDLLYKVLGENGLTLWEKARGIDNTPVIPFTQAKSIGTEQTFSADSMNVTAIRELISAMVMHLAWELRTSRRLASVITVKIRYSDFETHSKQRRIDYTALDRSLKTTALQLFDELFDKRLLLRLVGVKFSGLVSGYEQIALFQPAEYQKMYALYQAMDRMRNRFGSNAIKTGSTLKTIY